MPEERVPEKFRGLRYPPRYEAEVVLLFGMLLPRLDDEFVVEEYSDVFPDCTARRNGKKVGIEFEVNSSNFFSGPHPHDKDDRLPECNMVVCWENDLEPVLKIPYKQDGEAREQEIEVLALREFIERKGLWEEMFLEKTRPPTDEVKDEEQFFNELRKSVGDGERYHWFKTLIEVCERYPKVFSRVFGQAEHGGLHFQVRKWLSRKIGMPTPIQFYGDGDFALDYRGMPKTVEDELRGRMRQPKGKFRVIKVKTEETFNMIKGALEWLAENYDKDLPL